MRDVEKRAMVDARVAGQPATEHGGVPGVKVAVEVDHADGTPMGVGAAEGGEGGGVVAAEGDDAGDGAAVGGVGRAAGGGEGVGFVELAEGDGVVLVMVGLVRWTFCMS